MRSDDKSEYGHISRVFIFRVCARSSDKLSRFACAQSPFASLVTTAAPKSKSSQIMVNLVKLMISSCHMTEARITTVSTTETDSILMATNHNHDSNNITCAFDSRPQVRAVYQIDNINRTYQASGLTCVCMSTS